jgi:broad specificity phosphatase PhoE
MCPIFTCSKNCEGWSTAVYATEFVRTQQTAQPLADELQLTLSIYEGLTQEQIDLFAAQVQEDHYGKVVLIVGHSNTVPMIVDALGGESSACYIGAEYDNLCVVTVYGPGKAKVVNLQYGEPSP